MNTQLNRTGNEVLITITAEESDLSSSVRDTYNRLRKSVSAKGFRSGRVPNNIIDRELGTETVNGEVLETAAERFYRQALEEHDIHPVSNPHVEVKKFVPYTAVEIEIKVEVMPEVTLGNYKSVSVDKDEPKVNETEIEEVLTSLQDRVAERKPVERPAKDGDEIEIDFKGRKNGEDVPGASATNYPLLLGSNRFIPGFEDELVGVSAGDEKTFEVTFPKEYQEESLANQSVEFSVKVHKVAEIVRPKLDDEFAKNAGPFKSLEHLREDVESHLRSEKEQQIQRDYENKVVKEVVSIAKLDLPQTMVEAEKERIKADFQRSLEERSLKLSDYLKQTKQSEDDHNKQIEVQAEMRVRTALVLTKIAEAEDLNITPEELEIRAQVLAGQYQDEKFQQELSQPSLRREMANQMLAEKTVAKLVEYAQNNKPADTKKQNQKKKATKKPKQSKKS